MNQTTETTDPDAGCFEKAKAHGEPTFTLRAQDATAALFVETWVRAQIFVRVTMEDGYTLDTALTLLGDKLRGVASLNYNGLPSDPKLHGAIKIADAMVAWPNRKLAD